MSEIVSKRFINRLSFLVWADCFAQAATGEKHSIYKQLEVLGVVSADLNLFSPQKYKIMYFGGGVGWGGGEGGAGSLVQDFHLFSLSHQLKKRLSAFRTGKEPTLTTTTNSSESHVSKTNALEDGGKEGQRFNFPLSQSYWSLPAVPEGADHRAERSRKRLSEVIHLQPATTNPLHRLTRLRVLDTIPSSSRQQNLCKLLS